jgi:hypothetical protein
MIKVYEKDGKTLRALAQSVAEAMQELGCLPEAVIDAADLLAAQRAEAEALVVEKIDAFGARLTAGYPAHERESWPVKIAEARAVLAGETDAAKLPIIATECLFSGVSHADTAANILAKATPFAKASGAISGIRQVAIAKIGAAANGAAIAAALAWADAALISLGNG